MPSEEDFERIIQKIKDGIDWVENKLREFPPWVERNLDHWWIPGFVKSGVRWCMDRVIDLANWILDRVKDAIVGFVAPFRLIVHVSDWSRVSVLASEVQGALNPAAKALNYSWSGMAAERYSEACQPQADAAGAIKKAADDTRAALGLVIGAGLAFYIAVGVIIVQWIGTMGASTAAVASVVAAPAGAAAAAADSGISAAAITAAVVALTAVVAAQANAFGAITAAMDQSKFGPGDWPDSVEGHFADGTVNDGDNEWSVNDH